MVPWLAYKVLPVLERVRTSCLLRIQRKALVIIHVAKTLPMLTNAMDGYLEISREYEEMIQDIGPTKYCILCVIVNPRCKHGYWALLMETESVKRKIQALTQGNNNFKNK